jgi:hypothetical protein
MTPQRIALLSISWRRGLAIVAVLCLAGTVAGIAVEPTRALAGVLTSAFFLMTISLGATVFLALHHVAKAAWFVPIKRVPEAMSQALVVGAGGLLALLPAVPGLFEWSHESVAATLHGKEAYLDASFFAIRSVVVLGVWLLFAALLRRSSRAQDRDGDLRHTRRSVVLSAIFLVLLGISFSVASVDWLMSLSPHWQSTIFGWYHLAGLLLASVAAIAVVGIVLRRAGRLPEMTDDHVHDLGKLVFGFSTLWAYLWFSQYLLVWYANIPEETSHYLARTEGGWGFLFWLNLVAGWLIPFLALLPRRAKRSAEHLLRVSILVLAARWLDVYLAVVPAAFPEHPGIDWMDVAPLATLGSIFVLVLERALVTAPLVAARDPYLQEGSRYKS